MPTLNHSNNFQQSKQTRRGLFTLIISLAILLAGCANQPPVPGSTPPARPSRPASASASLIQSPAPDIAATVTAVHKLPPLSPEQAKPYLEIKMLTLACPEFHPNRQVVILRHMDWLMQPAAVPPELINLYGSSVSEQLIFGAAYTTAVEWKTGGRQPDSCLLPIGGHLNTLLVELDRPPLPEFAAPQ
jgi:hypothetical protein